MTPLGAGFALDLGEQPAVLARVLDTNADALSEARRLVAAAPSVRLLGTGSSRHAAGVGAAALELAGIRADVPPAPGAAVPPPVLRSGDVVVAVSQSGETPALVAEVRRAQDLGCRVIAVTNAGGTLARLADVALTCAAGPERVVAASKSVTATVLLLRALAGPVDPRLLADAVTALLALDPAPLVRGAHPTHVVAGGLGAEHVAAEVALKLAETGGRLLSSEPLVEHLHGPVAVPATTLALVHPDDPNTAALAGDVVRIGPHPSYDVVLPQLDDPACAAVLSLVAGQVAALAWSRRGGVDADAPRGLSKVTRTA
ncbi:MAG: SIS domain-containing protein [Mycobacteriales bacterium]|nr:SIS domain-containing protein [Mycobacteriales bacterium]